MTRFVCNDEAGIAKTIVVARPIVSAIQSCSETPDECLYARKLEIPKLMSQHDTFVKTLRRSGARVVDLVEAMADVLTKVPSHKLANLVFTRDPVTVTPKGVVIGRFRAPARRFETEVWETS